MIRSFLRRLIVVFAVLFVPQILLAQPTIPDSTFTYNKLGQGDIIPYAPSEDDKIYAANRIPEVPDELPVRTYVVTHKDIVLNGYTSLVDVLKTIPGFRTSQPGSGLLGETFLMRGMLGNVHTRILINGVSIRPVASPGMPLGAQLPIRQAERIEIILGPASSLYGADAMAGVINIVLPEISRPVEVDASVALNSGKSDEVHLSLGGKIGSKKNIVNYLFYGSNKVVGELNLDTDSELFSVDDSASLTSPFYKGRGNTPEVRDLVHESRMVGVKADYRGFSINGQALYRSDHSAIGSHPGVIAYHDPNTYIAENIYNASLQYNKRFGKKKNWEWNTLANYLSYKTDNNSSYTGIDHPISNDKNFIYGASNDFRIEQLFNYTSPDKSLNVLFGGAYSGSDGNYFLEYLASPFPDGNIPPDSAGAETLQNSSDSLSYIVPTTPINEYTIRDIAAFAQVYYKVGKFNLIGGLRYDKPAELESQFSPKLGVMYKVNSRWRARAFFARSFSLPSPYYEGSNYEMDGTLPPPQPPPWTPPETYFVQTPKPLQPEEITSFEAGTFYDVNDHLRVEIHYYNHRRINSMFPRIDYPDDDLPPPPDTIYVIGFENGNEDRDNSTYSTLQSFQGFINIKTRIVDAEIGGQLNFGEEEVEHLRGSQSIGSYRSMPDFMLQANVHLKLGLNNRISFYGKYLGQYISGVTMVNGQLFGFEQGTAGYYNLDIVYNRRITDNFVGQIRIVNAMNSINKGIYTNWLTGYEFDYIPQLQRWLSIGLTYSLR
jgi:outer membrane receptor protein involved in Fe transport